MANAALVFVSILTFNFWGLPDVGFRVLSPLRAERAAEVCARLKTSAHDVVLLQEVWVKKDRETLKKCGFAHAADQDDAGMPLDSGLLILSKYPLEKIARLTYPKGGDLSKLTEDGEALARKSAIVARVKHPTHPFWVADTHLISFYTDVAADDAYLETRRTQFRAFVDFAREAAGKEPLVLGGDFNFGRKSPLWDELRGYAPGFTEAPEAEKACTVCPPNTMHDRDEGKIDHLFASPGVTATEGATGMTEPLRADGFSISLSDHFGWSTKFGLSLTPRTDLP